MSEGKVFEETDELYALRKKKEKSKLPDMEWDAEQHGGKEPKDVEAERTLEQRRERYHCGSQYSKVSELPSWRQQGTGVAALLRRVYDASELSAQAAVRGDLNDKVCVWNGPLVELEIDGIVNAANVTLMGGGGVDGSIHRAAGPELLYETRRLNGCEPGQAKIARGYRLPAKYVLLTVGPRGEKESTLVECYANTLDLAKAHGVRTLAYPGISTGSYGYPLDKACAVAMRTTRTWLENPDNAAAIDRIVFVVYAASELPNYLRAMHAYFPLETAADGAVSPPVEDRSGLQGVLSSDGSPPLPAWVHVTNLTPLPALAPLPSPPPGSSPPPSEAHAELRRRGLRSPLASGNSREEALLQAAQAYASDALDRESAQSVFAWWQSALIILMVWCPALIAISVSLGNSIH